MAKERRAGGLQGIIAENVRRLRKAKGISQEQLA
jgi:ribosome-binding protein aMBF1 (putative translation factor)